MTFETLKTATRVAAACGAVLLAAPSFAVAGECPADQVQAATPMTGEDATGVTDEVISAIDLSSKGEAFKGYMLRMRQLVVEPGGVVPLHMHDKRAANILIVKGAITEYRTTCAVPIEHVAGDVVSEFGAGLAHWWRNNGNVPTEILSADLLPPDMPADDMM